MAKQYRRCCGSRQL